MEARTLRTGKKLQVTATDDAPPTPSITGTGSASTTTPRHRAAKGRFAATPKTHKEVVEKVSEVSDKVEELTEDVGKLKEDGKERKETFRENHTQNLEAESRMTKKLIGLSRQQLMEKLEQSTALLEQLKKNEAKADKKIDHISTDAINSVLEIISKATRDIDEQIEEVADIKKQQGAAVETQMACRRQLQAEARAGGFRINVLKYDSRDAHASGSGAAVDAALLNSEYELNKFKADKSYVPKVPPSYIITWSDRGPWEEVLNKFMDVFQHQMVPKKDWSRDLAVWDGPTQRMMQKYFVPFVTTHAEHFQSLESLTEGALLDIKRAAMDPKNTTFSTHYRGAQLMNKKTLKSYYFKVYAAGMKILDIIKKEEERGPVSTIPHGEVGTDYSVVPRWTRISILQLMKQVVGGQFEDLLRADSPNEGNHVANAEPADLPVAGNAPTGADDNTDEDTDAPESVAEGDNSTPVPGTSTQLSQAVQEPLATGSTTETGTGKKGVKGKVEGTPGTKSTLGRTPATKLPAIPLKTDARQNTKR